MFELGTFLPDLKFNECFK